MQKFQGKSNNDVGFAVAFGAHLALVLVWIGHAAVAGDYAMAPGAVAEDKVAALLQAVPHHSHQSLDDGTSLQFLLLLILAGVLFSLVWAGIWLVLLQAFPSQVVKAAILSLPALFGLLTLGAMVAGNVLGAGLFGLVTALAVWWVWCVWERIGYTSHIVKAASTCYAGSSGIFGVALVAVAVQAAWTLIWLLAVFPLCRGSSPIGALAWLLLLLSYFWTCQVVANVLYVSCSGVMARWYYGLQDDQSVAKSTQQACTHSFGSICSGSLLIAVIQTLKVLFQQAQAQATDEESPVGACLACVAVAILGCIEDVARIFNAYAFAYVAIYGIKFWDAGCQVYSLIENSGLEPLIHYSLIDTVSFFGTITGGLFTGGLTLFLAFRIGLPGNFIVGVAILGFLTGLAVMSVVSRIMEAGAITLFLCYAEKPSALTSADVELADLFNERRGLIGAKTV